MQSHIFIVEHLLLKSDFLAFSNVINIKIRLCVLHNENENKIHFEFFIIRLNKYADRDSAKNSHFKMYEV